MNGHVVAMLLDSALRTWGTREDLHMLLSKGLMARGAKVVLVFSEAPLPALQQRYESEGIAVEVINYKQGVRNYYRRLGEVVRKYGVTAVHIAFFNYFGLHSWMARLHGVRHIVYHERNPGVLRARSWKRQLLRFRTRLTSWPMTSVVLISEFLRDQLVEAGIPQRKMRVIHHGIDTQKYAPDSGARARLASQYGIGSDELVLASLCYLMPHKNIDTLLEAAKLLTTRGIAVRMFIIGEGPARDELVALGEKLGIASRIHWMGHIRDPIPVLQAADIFLLISEGEGFGLAIVEAMACGTAAIGSDSGAIPEIVENGQSGLIVPLRNAEMLAEAIQNLAADERLRRQIAETGLERVRELFSIERSTRKLVELYAATLK